MAARFPAFLDISGKLCVVVGGGRVAERKIGALLAAGARVRVVTPDVIPEIERLADEFRIEWIDAHYRPEHLDGAWLAFACTDSRQANALVAAEAERRTIFVNVADEAETGSAVVPTLVDRGDLLVAVTTLGASPALAVKLAKRIGAELGPEYAAFIALLRRMRIELKDRVKSPAERRPALHALVESEAELLELLRARDSAGATALANDLIEQALEGTQGSVKR